nr:hypothetical protein GCM10020185_08490 [Pseudomonas brassicacearum subsp. brassicacearum]
MASIWLLGGMIISFIGVVGIYLSKKYFSESKQRPYTIVRQIYAQQKKTELLEEVASYYSQKARLAW